MADPSPNPDSQNVAPIQRHDHKAFKFTFAALCIVLYAIGSHHRARATHAAVAHNLAQVSTVIWTIIGLGLAIGCLKMIIGLIGNRPHQVTTGLLACAAFVVFGAIQFALMQVA